jgi:hypothetical protein
MNSEQLATLTKLHNDFLFYAPHCLKIRAKRSVDIDGSPQKIIPLNLNTAQKYIHGRLEAQRKEKGYVRALLLKGRQQGCSTYVEGRFFHKTTQGFGLKTFILTHEDKATTNIFRMAKRYYKHCPPVMQPQITLSNAKELYFDKLDSAYGVGTAGSGDVGRSDTIDLFHGSEVAFWNNTAAIKTGVLQAAEAAQEIILESTANGMGNMFHQMWQDSTAGKGKYIAIFVPWYWQEEYREVVPEDFELTTEEAAYFRAYKDNGLTSMGQMVWRRNKIVELRDPKLFMQEYPATAAEAFQVTGHNALIQPEIVLLSRKAQNVVPYGSYVIGCDPAREGDDLTAFIRRQGRKAWGLDIHEKLDDMAKAGLARKILDTEPVDRMFIDRGGGSGMYDRLVEMGYGKRVSLINFGHKALDEKKYANRRAEMWCEMRDWLESEMETEIPDSDYLQADLVAPGFKYTSITQILLEKKEDIKKRINKSPDGGDALALTFAEPVAVREVFIPVQTYEPMDAVIGY